MSAFPKLTTGAVAQYPVETSIAYSTEIVRFIDGSEQRFARYRQQLKSWVIRLTMLNESELHSLIDFYRCQQGGAGAFSFTDPWNGAEYPDCSFAGDNLFARLNGNADHQITIFIRQNLA